MKIIFFYLIIIELALLILICDRWFQEPMYLDRCVVCYENDWDDYFELHEIATKDTYILKVIFFKNFMRIFMKWIWTKVKHGVQKKPKINTRLLTFWLYVFFNNWTWEISPLAFMIYIKCVILQYSLKTTITLISLA